MEEDSSDYISPADRTSDLIGDGSQPYALPTLNVRNDRFKRIDAATLVKLIDGHFRNTIESFTIIDCRYPYEYQGGHIVNSLNIHNTQELTKLFIDERHFSSSASSSASFSSPSSSSYSISSHQYNHHHQPNHLQQHHNHNQHNLSQDSLSNDSNQEQLIIISENNNNNSITENANNNNNNNNRSRHIIIFHCEFSSERGPKLMRFLREKDRQINKYPELLHPELYLLEGGYRDFYKKFKEYCVPQAYKPMNCRNHKDDLRKFRRRRKLSTMQQPRRKENRVPDISFEG